MIRIIAAVTTNGVIGIEGKIPFDYPEDMQHFKKSTLNSTIIMGRKTFEGIGRPLPKRRNIVITSQSIDLCGIETFSSIKSVMEPGVLEENKDIWFIGGAGIYQEAMQYAYEIVLTITPDYVDHPQAIRFPWINPTVFSYIGNVPLGTSGCLVNRYTRFAVVPQLTS